MTLRKMIILGFLTVPLLIPFPIMIVPEWKITVVDKSNHPLSGLVVKQSWRQYTVQASDRRETKIADNLGKVTFKKRVVWRNGLLWLLGGLGNYLSAGTHASFGSVSKIFARNGCQIGSVIYTSSIQLEHTLILNDRMMTKNCNDNHYFPPKE